MFGPTGAQANHSEDVLRHRMVSIFLGGPNGRRPCFGGADKFQHDPAWKDNLLFNEYFGENGAGLGASHQTGGPGSWPTPSCAPTALSNRSGASWGTSRAGWRPGEHAGLPTAGHEAGGASSPSGRRRSATAPTSPSNRASPRGSCSASSTPRVPRRRYRYSSATPACGTLSCPVSDRGRPTATGRRARTTPPTGPLQPGQAAARSLRPSHNGHSPLRPRGPRPCRGRPGPTERARLGRARAPQPRRRPGPPLGRPGAPAPPLRRHGGLRDPRERLLHEPPRHPARTARHLRGARSRGGTRPPGRPRDHGGGAAPGAPERPRAVPARPRADELLGLQQHRLLRAARRLLGGGARRPGRWPGGRVQAHGRRPPRCGVGSHPRRGLQPHSRGGPPGPDAVLPRPGQPRVLPPRTRGPAPLRRHHRLRQHGQRR